MANLVGDNGNTFYFTNASNLTGTIDGVNGANTPDQSACTIPVVVNLATSATTGVHGAEANAFRNIQAATGGPGSNLLFGPNSNNTLVLTGANVGNIICVFAFLRHAHWTIRQRHVRARSLGVALRGHQRRRQNQHPEKGGATPGKPTHFEVRDGKF
jgi:hypothetical protein